MAFTVITSASTRALFTTCASRFLAEAGGHAGPTGHPAQLWLVHRNQRDLLLSEAVRRGVRGWLNPPIQFLSALPQMFGILGKPIGLLERRELISSIGFREGKPFGITLGNADATITRGHMLDGFIGELLSEGVTTEQLRRALENTSSDEFAARRNAWICSSFEAYANELARMERYDPRSIHALVAQRIATGELLRALGGARHLHIYGLYSTRSRRALLAALAAQHDVDVTLYTTPAAAALIEFAHSVEDLESTGQSVVVQPAPDGNRELRWVARAVKKLILAGTEPHDIAIVARTGLEDTRRALYALQRAGIPATARTRTPLSQIAALKAVLDLFRGAAEQWSYRVLRSVIASPYFRTGIDLRSLDYIATKARPTSLAAWQEQLTLLVALLEKEETDSDVRRLGLSARRVQRDLENFGELRAMIEPLDGTKPLGRWLELTRSMLSESWFRFRQRICEPPEERRDIVRLDQRGVHLLERLLSEWQRIDDLTQVLPPTEWFRGLRALMEGQELVLTTPGQKGVQILEAHDAALTPFAAVFLVHANDGEFPRLSSSHGLFSDEERRTLRAAGLPIEDRLAALARERVLWEAVTGTEQLCITYRTSDARGTPLLPSLLVPPEQHQPELPRRDDVSDDPLNAEEDGRLAARQLARQIATGDRSLVHAPHAHVLRRAILNAYAELQRGAPDRRRAAVNPWNGQLRDPIVLALLAERYNDAHLWSASQMEAYTTLPFGFLLERVLDLKEISEAEEDTDRMTKGSIAHAVLERFYRDYLDRTAPAFGPEVIQRLVDVSADVIREWQDSGEWLGVTMLWEQRRVGVVEMLSKFLEWDLGQLAKGRYAGVVWRCEHGLGGEREFVEMSHDDVRGESRSLRLRGWIDRIDRCSRGDFLVIDYKSGSLPAAKGYNDGAVLQGPLYMLALQAEGHDARRALYRSLKDTKNGAILSIGDDECDSALRIAFSIPERVRRGLFEAVIANSAEWKDYHPGLALTRTRAQVSEGSRFDD